MPEGQDTPSWLTQATQQTYEAGNSKLSDTFSMLIDSGASGHFVDSELALLGLKGQLQDYTEVRSPQTITTAGLHQLRGIATGTLLVLLYDTGGRSRERWVCRLRLCPGWAVTCFPRGGKGSWGYNRNFNGIVLECSRFSSWSEVFNRTCTLAVSSWSEVL